jgi:transposase
MLWISFTEEDRNALHHERFHHPDPVVQRKCEVLYLKSCGLAHRQIAECARVDGNTMRCYFRQYLAGGMAGLKQDRRRKNQSVLVAYQAGLEQHFRQHPPATVNHAAADIARLTGVVRKPTQVRKFLKRMGLARRKVACVPAKADLAAQEEFKKNSAAQAG